MPSSKKQIKKTSTQTSDEVSNESIKPIISSKPKKNLSAYIYFSNDVRKKLQDKYPELSIKEITSKIGEKWHTLSNDERNPFDDLAKKDKIRYMEQIKTFDEKIKSGEIILQQKKKKKQKADKDKPKKNSSAYIYFSSYIMEQMKKDYPDKKITELAVIIGEEWSKLSTDQKIPFDEQAKKDKKRYQKEMKIYTKNLETKKETTVKTSGKKVAKSVAKIEAKIEKTETETKTNTKRKKNKSQTVQV